MSKSKPSFRRELFFAIPVFVFSATTAVLVQLSKPGWPDNHEGNSFFTRTALYAEHFKLHDILPIWSSIDNGGMGSPQPLLYHKFFYYLSGAFYAVSNSLKFSVGLTVALLLVIGALGIYQVFRHLEVEKFVALLGGLFFQFASYTTTVWIYRGAVAEFAFACLLPWFLLSCLLLLGAQTDFKIRRCMYFGFLLALLFYAHSSCTLALIVLTLPALVATSLMDSDWKLTKNRAKMFLIGSFFGAGFIVPLLIPMLVIGSQFGTARIAPSYLLPKNQMRHWFEYFNDSKFQWGEKFPTFTISFDRGIILLAILAVTILALRRNVIWDFLRRGSSTVNQSAIRFLSFLLLFAVFSQFPFASFIYTLPGMNFLQFPWRLLTVITPLVILVSIKVITRGQQFKIRGVNKLVIGLCLVATMATGGGFVPTKWQRIDIQPTHLTDLHFGFSLFGEYLPKTVTELPYQSIVLQNNEPNCTVARIGPTSESLRWMYKVECVNAGNVVLPIIASSYHVIDLISDISQSRNRCLEFNYLCEVPVLDGSTYVVISPPTFLGFWTSFFRL